MTADQGGKRRRHTPAEIDALLKQGVTQTEIARREGVTPQAISKRHRQYGNVDTRRAHTMQHWPWKVDGWDQNHASPALRARDHLEYTRSNGKGMAADQLQRLDSWYRSLRARDEVLEYDPEILPSEVSKHGGWRYVPREPSDGDLIIRVNEVTDLPENSRDMWRLPDVLPLDQPS